MLEFSNPSDMFRFLGWPWQSWTESELLVLAQAGIARWVIEAPDSTDLPRGKRSAMPAARSRLRVRLLVSREHALRSMKLLFPPRPASWT